MQASHAFSQLLARQDRLGHKCAHFADLSPEESGLGKPEAGTT